MEQLKVDGALVAELYKLAFRMQKPINSVLNQILRESIPYYKLWLNDLELAPCSGFGFEGVLTLRRTDKRFAHLYVCPICTRNFDVHRGKVTEVPLNNEKMLKLLVCANCGEPTRDTG